MCIGILLIRLLFTALLVSVKFLEDEYFSNKYYSKVAGVPLPQLNRMEFEFLSSLEFEVFIEKETFQSYRNYLLDLTL